jgi:AraC-like DNA-binding protein
MGMQVRRFPVDPLLVPYIDSIWTVTAEAGLSPNDIRTVPPDAKPELLVPIGGTMTCFVNRQTIDFPEGRIMVIGAMEGPAVLSSGPITNLGVEFRPGTAYRFLDGAMKELLNAVYPVETVLGRTGQELQWQTEDTPGIEEKVRLIQRFLIHRLDALSNEDQLIDVAVRRIQSTNGLTPVRVLCQELGHSKQHIERKFKDRLGLSPKSLSRILRFQSVYHRLMAQPGRSISWQDPLDLYYDQAHFIKEFKHFTGFSPLAYTQQINEFMQAFYQQ